MEKVRFISAIAAAAAVIACSKETVREEIIPVASEQPEVISGYFTADCGASKVTMDPSSGYKLSWEAGDKVAVYKAGGTELSEYTAKSAGATTLLEGAAVDTEANYYAVYPLSAASGFDGTSTILATVAASQELSKDMLPENIMVASTTGADATFHFKNVGSLIQFTLSGSSVSSIAISAVDGENVAGKIEIGASATPTYTVTEGYKTLVLTPAGGAATFEAGTYYAAILSGTYAHGISVKVYDSEGKQASRKQNKAQEITRSGRLNIGTLDAWTFEVNRTISTADEFVNFLSHPDSETWTVAADIDLGGVKLPSVAVFAGTLDGASHTIDNLTISAPLFTTLSGTVKDLTIGAGSSFVLPSSADPRELVSEVVLSAPYAFIAGTNAGTISGCTNNGTIASQLTFALSGDNVMSVGAFAGVNTGTVTGCVNAGAISLEPASIRKDMTCYYGGVVGKNEGTLTDCENTAAVAFDGGTSSEVYIGGVLGYASSGAVSGCTNSGEVTLANAGSSQTINGYVGGIAGQVTGLVIENCENSGDVTVCSKFSVTYAGGITGHSAGVTSCNNTGAIDYDFVNTEAVNTQSRQAFIGGITGRNVTVKVSKCNMGAYNGGITVKNGFAYTNPSQIGGIAGYSTQVIEGNTAANSSSTSRSTNSKAITVSGNIYANIGGVVGETNSTLSWVANGGLITVTNPAAGTRVGGLAGVHDSNNMQMSQSNGNINVTVEDGVEDVAVGGVYGEIGSSQTIHSSLVKTVVTTTNAATGLAVGTTGSFTVTLGTTSSASYNIPGGSEKVRYFVVKGGASVNGNAVTEETLSDYGYYIGSGAKTLANMKWLD